MEEDDVAEEEVGGMMIWRMMLLRSMRKMKLRMKRRRKGLKDLKASVAASWQDKSDPSSEKKRYQVRFCTLPL